MADKTRTTTVTQIRNLYSEGMSYMNIRFFNTNLCFHFYPFISRDNSGHSSYDLKNGLSTTVNFEGAYALYYIANAIIEGKIKEINHNIPCAAGANLNLQCKTSINGEPDVIFSINKNNTNISFRFKVIAEHIKNGQDQPSIQYIHYGLGAFMRTVGGYLDGINADRHLDKLTEDFVKSIQDGSEQPEQNQSQPQQFNNRQNNNQQNNNYRNNNYRNNGNNGNYNNNYKKPYNNNGYKRQYSNNGWNPPAPPQDLNSYEIKN
jgi:hypothetical protein